MIRTKLHLMVDIDPPRVLYYCNSKFYFVSDLNIIYGKGKNSHNARIGNKFCCLLIFIFSRIPDFGTLIAMNYFCSKYTVATTQLKNQSRIHIAVSNWLIKPERLSICFFCESKRQKISRLKPVQEAISRALI